ncbi:MAG TPA: hypothetical protein VEC37_13355 [Bacillota bacterium]|nr:hypothetical protein [Bacillota bacterium]
MKRKYFLYIILILMIVLVQTVTAETAGEALIFTQVDKGQTTLMLYETGQPKPVSIASGKDLKVFIKNKHCFYFVNRQLFEYNLSKHQSKLLNKFTETEIEMGVAAASNGLNQMVIAAKGAYEINYYILDLKDDSIRRVDYPSNIGAPGGSNGLATEDQQYLAVPKINFLNSRVELSVARKKGSKFQNIWTLPAGMTVIPELLTWSPDSQLLMFHAKKSIGFEGFYSLYCFNVSTQKMQMLMETVLYRDLIGAADIEEFLPDWSADSKNLVFQIQPTGSPTQSEIIRYDVKSGKTKSLTKSSGQNQHPQFSPSGNNIAFLSNRDQGQKQVYLMDSQGEGLKRIVATGNTQWAQWLNF